jgi:hypothetical protein
MVDVLSYGVTALTRDPEQSYDFAILMSAALIGVVLVTVIGLIGASGGVEAINPDSVLPYL